MTATHPELPADARPDDELVTEILARRRRRTPLLTLALVVLVAAGGAFVGGIEAQKHWGHASASTGAGGGARDLPAFAARVGSSSRAGGRFPSFGGSFGGRGSITRGTVKLIKGSTLYVTDDSGNTVLVRTSPASTVTKTVTGTVQTVLPGDTVTVTGTPGKNGSVTARSISIGGSGGFR
jgi:hypothetical protein